MSLANLLAPNELDIYCRSYSGGGDHPTSVNVQIGPGASATGVGSIAIGNTAVSTGASAIALGNNSTATGDNSTAIGKGAVTPAAGDVSIGNNAGGTNLAQTGVLKINGIVQPIVAVTPGANTDNMLIMINGTQYYLKATLFA